MRDNKLRKGVRSTPRKVRSRGIIYLIKRIITNFFIYVHASREMTAHLTRCALAHPADVQQKTLFKILILKNFRIMRYSKLRKGVRSTPRKVHSHGKVYYKKILVNINCVLKPHVI